MLTLSGLSKKFHNRLVVDQLNIEVASGELYGFLGPNGAGKTTTIKMITGLLRPDSGSISINGFDLRHQPIEAKRAFGYVSDQPFLYDRLTPREYFRFIGGLYRVSPDECDKRIDRWLDIFDLSQFGDELIGAFSHGMRQKTAIIGALLYDPPLLIIDEPLVGLDPKGAVTVKQLLRDRCEHGMAAFITTHSLDVAEQLADRIGILNNGKLIAEGTISDLRSMVKAQDRKLEEIFLTLTAQNAASEPVPSGY